MGNAKAERQRLLASQDLFRGLSERELADLTDASHLRVLAPREELFRKGDEGSQIFLIAEGRLAAKTTGPDGDDVIFSVMRAGQLMGELAVFTGGRRTATIMAVEEAKLVVLDRRELVPFLRRNPDAALAMIGVLAQRVLSLSELVEDVKFLNLPSRLAKRLLQLGHAEGRESDGALELHGYTQGDLAQMVATTRESVNKQLGRWSKAGVIATQGRVLTILDRERLAEEIEE